MRNFVQEHTNCSYHVTESSLLCGSLKPFELHFYLVCLTVHDITTHGEMFLAFPSVQRPGNESMINVCDNLHCTGVVICEKFSSVDIRLNDGLSPSTT